MSIKELTDHLIEKAPVATLISGLSSYLLSDELLNKVFQDHRQHSYQRKIQFSDMVSLLIPVVFGSKPSVCASYNSQNALRDTASLQSFYEKLNHLDLEIPQALVGRCSSRCESVLQAMQVDLPELLEGFRVRMIDGNHFESSERRLDGMETIYAPLPAMSLVVRDYQTGLIQQTIYDQDNWASELALVPHLDCLIQANDCFVGDNLYGNVPFLRFLEQRNAFYATRIKKSLTTEPQDLTKKPVFIGKTATGDVYEEYIYLTNQRQPCRCVVIYLYQPTRQDETVIRLISNLPDSVNALQIADLYLKRRSIESCFQDLATALNCEIDSLAYPKASALVFGLACCLLNVLQVVKHSLAQAQSETKQPEPKQTQDEQAKQSEPKQDKPKEKLKDLNLSAYYLIQEVICAVELIAFFQKVSEDYPRADWSLERLVEWLKRWSGLVKLKKYQKSKPQPNRKKKKGVKKSGTYSTKRMLDERRLS